MWSNSLSIPKIQQWNRLSLWWDKEFHPTLYMACDHLSMLGLELNHVDKGAPGVLETNTAMASAGYTDYTNIGIMFLNVCLRFQWFRIFQL